MRMSNFLAEEFHDIAPPLDYSLIPPWLVFVIVFVALSLLGLVMWLFAKRRKPALPPKLPREIALEELERIGCEIESDGAGTCRGPRALSTDQAGAEGRRADLRTRAHGGQEQRRSRARQRRHQVAPQGSPDSLTARLRKTQEIPSRTSRLQTGLRGIVWPGPP